MDDVYEWGKFLGEGSTSNVYRARLKSGHDDGDNAKRLRGRLLYDDNGKEIINVILPNPNSDPNPNPNPNPEFLN